MPPPNSAPDLVLLWHGISATGPAIDLFRAEGAFDATERASAGLWTPGVAGRDCRNADG
jgi:hypothetical protein